MSEYTTVGSLPVWHRTREMLLELRKVAVGLRDHTREVRAGLEQLRAQEAAGRGPQTPVKGGAEGARGTRPAGSTSGRQGQV